MKKLIFGFLATLLFSLLGSAQEKVDFNQKAEFVSSKISIKSQKELSTFSFKSVEEFNEGSEILLKDYNFEEIHQDRAIADKCEVTIEVSVTVSVGVASVTVSGQVTTTCENAAAAVRKLRNMLMAAAMGG